MLHINGGIFQHLFPSYLCTVNSTADKPSDNWVAQNLVFLNIQTFLKNLRYRVLFGIKQGQFFGKIANLSYFVLTAEPFNVITFCIFLPDMRVLRTVSFPGSVYT